MVKGDWRKVPAAPSRPFDSSVFHVVTERLQRSTKAVRGGLQKLPRETPGQVRDALGGYFDFQLATCSLAERSHGWASFLEPQITRGFVHFLRDGDRERSQQRCRAFVRAALDCCGRLTGLEEWNITRAEAIAEENRIDILVELECGAIRFGAVIEAKFEHRLTGGQLESARNHSIEERQWDVQKSAYVVIAPLRQDPKNPIMKRNGDWHSISWWSFLRNLEQRLERKCDCDDYRRFRRTVWTRAYLGAA